MTKKEKAQIIAERLKKEFPKVEPPLNHSTAHELLIAVILSAQCTDERVNKVTKDLFKKYKTVTDFAEAELSELEQDIKSTGFYKNKAKNVKAAAQKIVSEHGGAVPDNMSDLVSLPGVGRKTANVVLGQWFKQNEGFVVDTHVKRIAYKAGLTDHSDPEKIEKELMELFPREEWTNTSLRIIFHGRTTCPARSKSDHKCSLGDLCSR